ncbi:MAG: ECF-type sigma factor [Xanthomonadales bacterium]|jgi:RNA polymerase sigma factor (TIGR02999 family)|nr:ECF-type sigma factor [Xanthomonadales bacterium]
MHATADIDADLAALRDALRPALARLMPALHADLKQLAAAQRRRFASPPTLSTTAVVHELYLKLVGSGSLRVESQRHFFALAALAMRQILADHARKRLNARAAGLTTVIEADAALPVAEADLPTIVGVDTALTRLAEVNPRLVEVVNCRFFGGYSEVETAEILGVSDRTVRRDWDRARAWLAVALGSG